MKTFWITYGVIIGLSTFISMIASLQTSAGQALIGFIFTSVRLVGLYGYATNQRIWSRLPWKILAWLLVAGAAINITQDPTIGLIDAALLAPLAYALFKYSARSNPIWPDEEVSSTGQVIHDVSVKALHIKSLLEKSHTIKSTTISEDQKGSEEKTTVRISTNDSGSYLVEVITNNITDISSEFSCLNEVVTFIEDKTNVRAYDYST